MKKNLLKKLVTLAIAGTMVMSTGVVAFASEGDTTSLETHLYKDGKYDSSDKNANLSMGDGAVEATTYVEEANGKYNVTFNFKPSFTAEVLGIEYTGYLTKVEVDLDDNGEYDDEDDYSVIKEGSAVIGISFETDSIPRINTEYDAKFTINISRFMSHGAEGDIVVLPGVTSAS